MDAGPAGGLSRREKAAAFLARQGIVQALRHRDFAIYTFAGFVSIVGFWVMRIGIGWFAWELTHSGVWLGVVALAQAIPAALVGPFAGALADRHDRLAVMRAIQLVSAAVALGLAGLTWAGLVDEIVLTAAAVLYGAVFAFGLTVRSSIGPNLVPKDDLPAAIAVGSVTYGTSAFIGPAIAGIVIAKLGIAATFAVNAATFVLMYVCIRLITLIREEHRPGGHAGLGKDVVDGVRYAAAHAGIGPVLVLALLTAMLVRSLADLMPGFSDLMYGRGVEGLAILMAGFGAGALSGALWIANRNRIEGTTRIMLAGAISSAVLTVVLTLTHAFVPAVTLMCLIGFTGACWQNTSQILIQHAVEGSMRARVMSLFTYNFGSAPSLGAMLLGGASALIGLPWAIAAGSLLALLVLAWVCRRAAGIRQSMEIAPALDAP